ncbi:MAG: MOSC N-terminal beta barrel domain-containing protein [Thermoleophilia bacterium]|nr:MOSC N-terminal beta barrel domain-containing protein [Thermoleophilia bacterium]
MARVAWLALAPVKGLRLVSVESTALGPTGIDGDRRYLLVDADGRPVNAKRCPRLLTVVPEVAGEGRLRLRFPDGTVAEGEVELGGRIVTTLYGGPIAGRLVLGPWSAALSEHAGMELRLVQTEREGEGFDRGARAAVSLLSTGSLRALAAAAGVEGPVDGRRFRMTVGVEAGEHAEDGWLGQRLRVGGAVLLPRDRVGRCAVTTRHPETGERDLDTLAAIASYRGDVASAERLPFGVWCEVLEPGPVAVGDSVELLVD